MRIHISNLDDEWSHSIVILLSIVLNNEPSHHNSMVAKPAHISRPPLSSRDSGWIDDKLIPLLVKCSSRFQLRHIWAMSQLSLGVTTVNVKIEALGEPVLPLLLRPKLINGLSKHRRVHSNGVLSVMINDPVESHIRQVLKIIFLILLVHIVKLLHPMVLDFIPSHFVIFMSRF